MTAPEVRNAATNKRKQLAAADHRTEDAQKKKAKKSHTALPWMRVPAAFPPAQPVRVADVCGLDCRLVQALRATGHSELFPVQAVAWEVLAGGMSTMHDLCIDAPTGSGKTLAYVLPVLQRCLCKPVGSGVHALVVVPTRALAGQVFDVFRSLQRHLPPMHVVLANGSSPVAHELSQLSGARASEAAGTFQNVSEPAPTKHREHEATPRDTSSQEDCKSSFAGASGSQAGAVHGSLTDLLPIDRKVFGHPHRNCKTVEDILKSVAAQRMEEHGTAGAAAHGMHGGSVWRWGPLKPQVVSVAVVTPGRLTHHLRELGHRWLENLELLVVDEADRLLRQAYNEWLPVLNDALSKNSEASGAHAAGGTGGGSGALTGQFVALARSMPSTKRLVKVLVSATLTKDPTKLAKMDLKFPRYISVDTPPPAAAHHAEHVEQPALPEDAAVQPKKKKKRKKSELEEHPAKCAPTPPPPHLPPDAANASTAAPVVTPAAASPAVEPSQSGSHVARVEAPTTMHEYQVITAAHTKPHALLALLSELKGCAGETQGVVRAIVFASAVDAARRLTNLLEGCGDALGLRVFEMSSRVASRVQGETLVALQSEASW